MKTMCTRTHNNTDNALGDVPVLLTAVSGPAGRRVSRQAGKQADRQAGRQKGRMGHACNHTIMSYTVNKQKQV